MAAGSSTSGRSRWRRSRWCAVGDRRRARAAHRRRRSAHLDQDGLVAAVLHPLSLIVLVASLAGLFVSARSLQLGEAVPVIAITSAAANSCTIAAGPLVFGEPMPASALGIAVRIAAFALVVVAAALTPPPVPAREAAGEIPRRFDSRSQGSGPRSTVRRAP